MSTEGVTNEEPVAVKQEEVEDTREKHPLQFPYCIWFNRRVQGARTQENYEKNIKKVGSFATVEDFWDYYVHLVRPNDLPNTSDYHLFKEGIKPMWEDDANRHGGKWILRLRKGLATRFWEDLVLAVVGDQFEVGDEICGAVISIRYQEDILSLWTKTATDYDTRNKILDVIKRVLNLDSRAQLEYKNHDASIRDNSSFRNTEPMPIYMGDRADAPIERRRFNGSDSRFDRGGFDKSDRDSLTRSDRGERFTRFDTTSPFDKTPSDRDLRGGFERFGEKEEELQIRSPAASRSKPYDPNNLGGSPMQRRFSSDKVGAGGPRSPYSKKTRGVSTPTQSPSGAK